MLWATLPDSGLSLHTNPNPEALASLPKTLPIPRVPRRIPKTVFFKTGSYVSYAEVLVMYHHVWLLFPWG